VSRTAEPRRPDAVIFSVAWLFWAISAALGLLLRLQPLAPIPGLVYGHVLHAHSHLAFLGWIYNAFFALALRCFVPPEETHGYWKLFLVTQVAVAGMMLTYPFQGYAAASITFSTLHMVVAGVLAWKLLRRNCATPLARRYLWAAIGCMLLSGLGPLTLGPLAALGLRESPWYLLSIYFYLHFQYNGWFIFFLLAVLLQRMGRGLTPGLETAARRAFGWLVVGTILSLALSALWTEPGAWVYAAAAVGGAALLVATRYVLPVAWSARPLFRGRLALALAGLALAVLVLKHALQFFAAWPAFAALAQQRLVVIGFLHLVFLGLVSPLLIAWALEWRWLQPGRMGHVGLGLLGSGFVLTQAALFYPPLAGMVAAPAWPWLFETLLAGAAAMVLGIVMLVPALRMHPPLLPSDQVD
jgi:hypothetical protein